ncbi:hypothetical protein BKA00_006613 [Actinomadura coerulea]|uniref:Cysteine-rich CPCC domain-containing protein n=1 Tax=Actinomadura coerulea TaxID=46159 RepID=A0A7X0G5A7_9ACTN|nr:CPCC family cysteine-rich protein [Actinomadura coerulea]MBB6399699.1 hypothetical protein [Actinomadura coerulea]GGQ11853.1 hypothetical protein GCM10010187_29990 [Actinomadura coerulea]
MDLRYPCVCCGHLTMEALPGSHQICPVCFWEDDVTQLRWPDQTMGANRVSLIQAQQNFKILGACEEQMVRHVRLARDDEPTDLSWRAIDPQRDRFEPRLVSLAPWPDDYTAFYWWRRRSTHAR